MLEIRNVRLPESTRSVTIRIRHGKIDSIGYETGWEPHLDVKHLTVLPGFINVHVHDRFPGDGSDEDYPSLIKAALHGGHTYMAKMPNTDPPIATAEMLDSSERSIGQQSIPHQVWFGATNDNDREIELVADDPRVCGTKLYMGSSTNPNMRVTQESRQRQIFEKNAHLHRTVATHAEDEDLMLQNRRLLGRQPLLTDHCIIRDTAVAVSATKRALRLAKETGCSLHICHVSTPEEVELIQDAKQAGLSVTLEACPHHFLLDDTHQGGYFKMNPPLRTPKQRALLLEYLCRPGMIDMVADDHAPHPRIRKRFKSYDSVPSGVPGVQTTVPLLIRLVVRGKMSWEQYMDLTAVNPAQLLGLKTKGKIEAGYDADLIFVRPVQETVFRHDDMHYKCGWTPFDGIMGNGVPQLVVINGRVALDNLEK